MSYKRSKSPSKGEKKKKKIDFTYPKGNYPRLCLVGNSNVGKSSLTKLILSNPKYYKGKVGKTPGSTIKLNIINDPKKKYQIIDLPGFGKMKKIKDKDEIRIQEQILDYIKFDAENIFLCIAIANLVRLEDELDKYYFNREDTIPLTVEFIQFILNHNVPCILVLNKMDRLNRYELKRVKDKLNTVLQDFGIEPQKNQSNRILKIFETSTLKRAGTIDVLNYIHKRAQKIDLSKYDARKELYKKEPVDVIYEKKHSAKKHSVDSDL